MHRLFLIFCRRLCRRRQILGPTLPLSSIPRSHKHTAASAVRDVHSGASSLLLPPPTHQFLLLCPWDHLPLTMPLTLLPITQARNCYASSSVVVPKYSFEAIHLVKDYLSFGLLSLYLIWWRFTLVTVGRASLPYPVWYIHRWKQLRCKLNTKRLYKEYTILWFEFDLCGLQHRRDREKSFKASHNVKDCLPFGLLTSYFFWRLFSLVTVGRASLPCLVWCIYCWKSWVVNWMPIDFTRNIPSFGLRSICVVCDIDETQRIQHKITTLLVRGHFRDHNKSGTIAQDDSTQRII